MKTKKLDVLQKFPQTFIKIDFSNKNVERSLTTCRDISRNYLQCTYDLAAAIIILIRIPPSSWPLLQ